MSIDFTPSETSVPDAIERFVQAQESLDKISHLRNFQAVVEVLRGNQLEHKDRKIYRDLSVLQLTQEVYERLLSRDHVDPETKDMLMTLYQTKDLNSPYFFSLSFSIGVFLPLLSPILFPPLITLAQILKLKVCKKPKPKAKVD